MQCKVETFGEGHKIRKISHLFLCLLFELQCMAFVELPFMEDIRSYPFAPLSIDTVKQEQLDAVDELIDDLLVVDSEETDEKENVLKVEPKEVLNPYYQHLYACLTHRVLHPGTQFFHISLLIKNRG